MNFYARDVSKECGCDAHAGLISIDEALRRVATCVRPVKETETVALSQAIGRVLQRAVCATADMPRFDHAAMDGYALKSADLTGEGPWRLPVVDRVAAGEAADQQLPQGAASRIFTGAPIMQCADCVVMQEKVALDAKTITFSARPAVAENIRFRGEERARGDVILKQGNVLSARSIAACAAAGHGAVTVTRKVQVALLSTGAEVAQPWQATLPEGQIWDVNTPMLQALLMRSDVDLRRVAHIPDDLAATKDALCAAADKSDLIVTTGGVSVGEEDHLHAAIAELGGQTHFRGVSIKPGKPVALGQIGKALWLGLPGNPGSAFVTWTIFGECVLQGLTGAKVKSNRRHVMLGQSVTRKPGRCEVRPVRIDAIDGEGREVVTCLPSGGSGQVTGLAHADGLVLLPAETDYLPQGAMVAFLPLFAGSG